jgi:hypothetical protein
MDRDLQGTQKMKTGGTLEGRIVGGFFHLQLSLYCFTINQIHQSDMQSCHME